MRIQFLTRPLAATIFVALASTATMAPTAANAQGYMGVSVGFATTEILSLEPALESYISTEYGDTCATVTCTSNVEDVGFAGKLMGGYRFSPNFAVEGFLLSASGFSTAANDDVSVTMYIELDTLAYGVAAVGLVPVSDRIELFGKAGGFYYRSEVSGSRIDTATPANNLTISISEDGSDFLIGAGAQIRITDAVMLRAEYEYFNGEEGTSAFTLGAMIGF